MSIASPVKLSAPVAKAAALGISEPPRSGLSFLTLPPEIRNQIYEYLFTFDGEKTLLVLSCRYDYPVVLRFPKLYALKGSRESYRTCLSGKTHIHVIGTSFLTIVGGPVSTKIIQTCRTIAREAGSIMLSRMHLNAWSLLHTPSAFMDPLESRLHALHQPLGAYISRFSYSFFPREVDGGEQWDINDVCGSGSFGALMNQVQLHIGHFEINCHDVLDGLEMVSRVIRVIIAILDSLDQKPNNFTWLQPSVLGSEELMPMVEGFNEAVKRGLDEINGMTRAKRIFPPPLLRDFLPQYSSQSYR